MTDWGNCLRVLGVGVGFGRFVIWLRRVRVPEYGFVEKRKELIHDYKEVRRYGNLIYPQAMNSMLEQLRKQCCEY